MLLASVAFLAAAAAAQAPSMSVTEVLAKSEALEKKGLLAYFSSDLRQIKAEAKSDVDAFGAELLTAWKAHRPLPACPPQDSNGWKFTFNTDEVLQYYRSIPVQRRAMSSREAFAEFMSKKFPCPRR